MRIWDKASAGVPENIFLYKALFARCALMIKVLSEFRWALPFLTSLQFEQMSRRFVVDQIGKGTELDVALAFVEPDGGESAPEPGQVEVDGVFGGMKVVFGALPIGGRFQVSVKPGVENIETACGEGAGVGRGGGGIGRRGEGDGASGQTVESQAAGEGGELPRLGAGGGVSLPQQKGASVPRSYFTGGIGDVVIAPQKAAGNRFGFADIVGFICETPMLGASQQVWVSALVFGRCD